MDSQVYCGSSLSQIWSLEALACSNRVEASLLLDLLKKTPQIANDIGQNTREWVSLKFLESLFIQGARANPVSSALRKRKKVRLDPSDHCEDVLRRILSKTSLSHLESAGPEISKWDLEPFIEHKKSNLPRYALKQLKDAILTGSPSISSYLKEQSGLPVRSHAKHQAPAKYGDCNGNSHRVEGHTDDGNHLRDLPDENLVPVNRKRRASESPDEQLYTTCKKNKHDSIFNEQHVGGQVISSGVHIKLTDASTVSLLHIEGKRFGLERSLLKPHKHDTNECTSSGLVDPNGVLPCEKEVPYCDNGQNNKSKEQQTQEQNIEEEGGKNEGRDHKATNDDVDRFELHMKNVDELEENSHVSNDDDGKDDGKTDIAREESALHSPQYTYSQEQNIEEEGGKSEACDLKTTNDDVDRFEQHMKNVDEVEENSRVSSDNDGNDDGKTDIPTKENALHSPQYTCSQDSLETTNSRDQNLLSDASKRYSEERCSLEKDTCVEVMRQNGSPGNGNNQCNSSKDLIGNVHILPHCGTEVLNEKLGVAMQSSNSETRENGWKGFHGLISTNEDIDKFDQNVPRTVPTVGEAEAYVDISSDTDGYHDERTTVDTKKKIFLSSQCTYGQDSFATKGGRELHICMKCRKGGNLLSCTADSCAIVIHESCLGSDVCFDTRETFYCPFCAYSRAISKYVEVKKFAFLARKDFATFICSGPQNEPNKQPRRSFRMDGNRLKENDGLPKSNELNQINVVEKVSNHKERKKLEYEQAGPSKRRSDFSPPFGRKAADSSDRLVHGLRGDKQDGKGIRQESRHLRGCRRKLIASEAIHNSQNETVVSETSGSENHADVRSKKGLARSPETDLPCKGKYSQSSQSIEAEELSEEENEHSRASEYRLRVHKQERQNWDPAIPQLRRRRLPWTSEEEDKLKEGLRVCWGPHDIKIPWTKILRHGEGIFQLSRTTGDLKDKWRNMCKANPKSK